MNELLNKRMADLTVLEVIEFAEVYAACKYPTMTMDEFCKVVNKSKRRVYNLLDNKLLPEELIVGGYESRKQRKSPIFHRNEVIAYLKQ